MKAIVRQMLALLAAFCGVMSGGLAYAYDAPADPQASAGVKKVLQYLGEIADSDKVLSGQFRYDEGLGGDCVTVHKATGQWPTVLEHYFYVASAKPQARADEQNDRENQARRQKMLDYWKNGGLVSIWAKLLVRHSGVRQAPGDWADVWKPGTPKNNTLKAHFERFYIPHMKWLQERGVVLIFRAYNEECEYFKDIGDENMKRLWVWTFDYFTKTHGLHNLIWFYAGNRGVGEQYFTRYPGDQYVDMVGFSNYTIKKPEPRMVDSYNMIRKRLPGKIFALAEEGWDDQATGAHDSREIIEMIRTRMPRTAYWLSWSQHWSPARQLHCVELYKDPWVVNRDQVDIGLR